MAGYPEPRKDINPKLREAVRASRIPGWKLATIAGIPHHARFSLLINAEAIPDTATNVERLYRIADAVGFPRADVFLAGEPKVTA